MKRNQLIGGVVLLVVIGAGAFYAGMSYAKSASPARGQFAAGAGSGFAGRGAGRGGGFTAGQVISSGNGSITIQSMTGSSTEIVLVSSSTQILKSTSGTLSDLSPGTNVVVTGTGNSDGSMTAQSIQVRPAGMNFPARGGSSSATQ